MDDEPNETKAGRERADKVRQSAMGGFLLLAFLLALSIVLFRYGDPGRSFALACTAWLVVMAAAVEWYYRV